MFINGRFEKKFENVEVPLTGMVSIGKGYLNRYWRGNIADVRISLTIRHTTDFEPEKTTITRDEHTLYLMDAL